jgi:hypothetical protein
MVAERPVYQTDNTIYTHCKHWPMQCVSSGANSECAYLKMTETSKHVVHPNRSCADGNKYNWYVFSCDEAGSSR